MTVFQGYQFAEDDYESEAKEEEDEILKVEVITSQPKQKEIPLKEEEPQLQVMDDTTISKPISSNIEPIYEDDFFDDGEFAYDEFGNIIGRIGNQIARDRWHWAFTKIAQVG